MEKLRAEEFLLIAVRELCQTPETVRVETRRDDRGVLMEVMGVDPADLGNVIGKKGQNINAIRTLVRAIGSAENAHVSVKVNDPENENFGD